MAPKIVLNFITVLFGVFICTGYFFFLVTLPESISRTYNSICGLIIVLSLSFFILIEKELFKVKYSIVSKYIILWLILIVLQTALTSKSLDRFIINIYYVSIWTISYLFFYLISSANIYKSHFIISRMIYLSIIVAFVYFFTASIYYRVIGLSGSVGNSYYVLCFMPWVFVASDKRIKIILSIVFLLAILLSAKRTSILAVAFFLIVYFSTFTKKYHFLVRILFIALAFVVVGSLYYFVDKEVVEGHITERFSNFARGADTRNEIRADVLKLYEASSLTDKLIGHGYNSVIETNKMDLSAHNDYVETLYDHGLIMLILQLLIIARLFFLALKLRKTRDEMFPSFISSVFLYIIMAYTTHLILYPYYFCFLTGFWGFVEGRYVYNKRTEMSLNSHRHSTCL